MKGYRESHNRYMRQMKYAIALLFLIGTIALIMLIFHLEGYSNQKAKPKTFKYGISFNGGWKKRLTNSYKKVNGNYVFTDQTGNTVSVPEKKVEYIVCPKDPYVYNE